MKIRKSALSAVAALFITGTAAAVDVQWNGDPTNAPKTNMVTQIRQAAFNAPAAPPTIGVAVRNNEETWIGEFTVPKIEIVESKIVDQSNFFKDLFKPGTWHGGHHYRVTITFRPHTQVPVTVATTKDILIVDHYEYNDGWGGPVYGQKTITVEPYLIPKGDLGTVDVAIEEIEPPHEKAKHSGSVSLGDLNMNGGTCTSVNRVGGRFNLNFFNRVDDNWVFEDIAAEFLISCSVDKEQQYVSRFKFEFNNDNIEPQGVGYYKPDLNLEETRDGYARWTEGWYWTKIDFKRFSPIASN